MYLLNQDKDNIASIVKSLRPIKYLYSKQNKDYDKYFRGSCLKDLVKQLKTQRKFNEFLKPGESLDEINNDKSIMDINFKSTFNYIEELSNLKNLPISILNKSDHQSIKNTSENKDQKKNLKLIRINEQLKNKNLIQAKKNWDADVTLDPGRYHPNYNYIMRRYPCAFLGKPKNEEYNNNAHNSEENKKGDNFEKKRKNEKNNTNENSNENNDSKSKKKNKNKKNKNLNEYMSNRTFHNKNFNIFDPQKKLSFNKSNHYGILKKNTSKNFQSTSHPKDKFASTTLKDQNTASSWTNTVDFETSKKGSEQFKSKERNISIYNNSKVHFYSTQRGSYALRKNKKDLLKNTSMENLRCPIIFDKMQGRDRPTNFLTGMKEGSRTLYNPDYNIVRPHIPSYIFKSERKYQEFKKYITGKIIRSYCYNPEEYFAIEYKENKENEMSGKYGIIVLKS